MPTADPVPAAGLTLLPNPLYLHALAGEHVRAELGPVGMLAGDLLPALPRVMKELRGQ